MSSIDFDLIKQKSQIKGQSTQVNQTTETKSENVSFMQTGNTDSQIIPELGISADAYMKICGAYPLFGEMSVEDQLKFIKSLVKESKSNDVDGQNNVDSTQAANSPDLDAVDKKESVEQSSSHTETTNQAQAEQQSEISTEEFIFDKKAFNKANSYEKYAIFIEEYAKNKFLYGGETKHTLEEWAALSDEERTNVYLAKAELEIQKDLLPGYNGNEQLSLRKIDALMLALQASNILEISHSEFKTRPESNKSEYVYEYLFGLDESERSALDNEIFNEQTLVSETASALYKQNTGSDVSFCPGEAQEYIESLRNSDKNFNILEEEYKLIKEKLTAGKKVSEYQMNRYNEIKELKDLSHNGTKIFGKRAGDIAKLKKEILSSEFAEEYLASDNTNKAIVIASYLNKTYSGDPNYAEILDKYRMDAAECGDISLAFGLHKQAKFNKKVAHAYASDTRDEAIVLNSSNPNVFDADNVKIAATVAENSENKELAEQAGKDFVKNAEGDIAVAVSEVTSGSQFESVQKSTVEKRNSKDLTTEQQLAINKNVFENSGIEARELAVLTTGEMHEEAQVPALKVQLQDNNPRLAKAAATVPSTLAEKNQIEASQVVFDVSNNLEKTDRIEVQKALADNIAKCAAKNQAEIHKIVMQSKDDEVLEHAASNIYKYDESAQADAIKYTYETNNSKAIDACNGQIEQCSPDAVEKVGRDIVAASVEQTRERIVAEASRVYADSVIENNKINNNQTEAQDLKGLSDKEKVRKLYEEFKKSTPAEQFRMLSKLSKDQLKTVIGILCKANSSVIKGLVAQGLGTYVLQTIGKSPDVLYMTVDIMMKKGGKDAKCASEYVVAKQSTTHFADNTIEKANEILGYDDITTVQESETQKYVSNPYGFMKSALRPNLSALYPGKKELFFKA